MLGFFGVEARSSTGELSFGSVVAGFTSSTGFDRAPGGRNGLNLFFLRSGLEDRLPDVPAVKALDHDVYGLYIIRPYSAREYS